MLVIIVLAPATLRVASAQSPIASTAPVQSAADHGATEIESRDEMPSFKVNARLVLVRVVVRDAKGNIVPALTKDDFQLFDRGHEQSIAQFSSEGVAGLVTNSNNKPEPNTQPQVNNKSETDQGTSPQSVGETLSDSAIPRRLIAYVFDDEHLRFGELARVRDAAQRHFKTLQSTDRAAIFTTSGRTTQDFTDDRASLEAALLRLKPVAETDSQVDHCPNISYYMADLIVNKHDNEATQAAMQDYVNCSPSNPAGFGYGSPDLAPVATRQAPQIVSSTAQRVLDRGDSESRISLGLLKDIVNRLSHMPGQRSMVLVSSGFLTPQMEYQLNGVIDGAVHAEVSINAIDARGVYVIMPGGDASKRGMAIDPAPSGGDAARLGLPSSTDNEAGVVMSQYEAHAAIDEEGTLSSLADGTGGAFFRNNNDFDEGFRVAASPEYSYLLGFVPQHLKTDGSFHVLKVTLRNGKNLSVQARSGYFAPNGAEDAATEAKREIEDEVYSQESLNDLPLTIGTQFFRTDNNAAKLIVLSHLDARRLQFEKTGDRHNDEITVASAVFDKNGNFLQGTEKVVTLNLKDENWTKTLQQGITMRAEFELKSGRYIVRVVAREMNGRLSALNTAAEIY
jgi:VWFA-related protein